MSSLPLVLIFVPGLSRNLLDGGGMSHLAGQLDGARQAGLVPSFPCLPSTVEASALRGTLPSRHGIRLPGDTPDPLCPTVGERLAAVRPRSFLDAGTTPLTELEWAPGLELLVVRHPHLLEAAMGHGIQSRQRVEAAAEFDTQVAQMRDALPPHCTVMISGAPGVRAARAVVQLPPALGTLRMEKSSAVLRVEAGSETAAREIQDTLLSVRGVERVLRGEALRTWGVSQDPTPTELIALAQTGWSFEEQAAAVGHPLLPRAEAGILISLGAGVGPDWPAELHDYRLAPSLARRFGLPDSGYLDRAFAT